MGKLRVTTPDDESHDLNIKDAVFGRDGLEFQCRPSSGKAVCIASGDVAITRFKKDRSHFRIFEKDGKMYIQDTGSGNGTFVNGKSLPGFVKKKGSKPLLLPHNCTLKVGQREFRIKILTTSREPPVSKKRAKADKLMDHGFFKRAHILYLELENYALAKKAKTRYEEEKRGIFSSKKVVVQSGAQYYDVKGDDNILGNVDETTKELAIEKEELRYLRETSKADLEVMKMTMEAGGSIEGKNKTKMDDPGIVALVEKIRADNPDMSVKELMERLKRIS